MPDSTNHILIRDRSLPLDELIDRRFLDPVHLLELKAALSKAEPFPHLVLENLFNPVLLELVHEEFDTHPSAGWKTVGGQHEWTQRSIPGTPLGPASQVYFSIVNSGPFIQSLALITSTEDLVVDPLLYGGGLHETRKGGRFDVHRDFDRHLLTGLNNEMVMITYLNKGWEAPWNGALELWEKDKDICSKKVEPEFGRTIIMQHGPNSFHGHSTPLDPPNGITRRSVASYYYKNLHAHEDRALRETSVFIHAPPPPPLRRFAKLRDTGKALTPPIIWDTLSKQFKRFRG